MSDENPFQCKHPNCGRSFTKEEHLSQHMKKHELGLATQHLNEPEQTPTPTRGLHLGDLTETLHLPLTADLDAALPSSPMRDATSGGAGKTSNKQPSNPFDRAFRAANFELRRSISNTSVDSNKTIPVINNLAPQGMLRTPQPSISSINSDTLGLAANLMQLGSGSGEISFTGLLPISPLPSTSGTNANAKPSTLSKNSTITSFLASLGFTGTDEATDGTALASVASPTVDQLAKAAASSSKAEAAAESYLSSINLQDQPQVLLLHTPQPQTPSEQGQMMLPLAMNAQGALVHNASGSGGGAGISSAQLYVPYILQDNGTMVPLGRLGASGGLAAVDASTVTLQEGILTQNHVRSNAGESAARNSVDADVDVDSVPLEEEAVTSSSTLSTTASEAQHRPAGRTAAEGRSGGASGVVPDKKDKVKEAIRRRCATSAADSMSPAPPRKRFARQEDPGAASASSTAAAAPDESDSNRSSTSGGGTPNFLLHMGQPIRGRKALELAAKLEMAQESDRKRDQLEKKLLYLERNRAASQRSRDKKKKIMTDLRDKNRIIDTRNKQLEQANLRLREEVVYLKSLLLQHIDCPKLPFQLKAAEGFKNEPMTSFLLNGGERPGQVGESAGADLLARSSAIAANVAENFIVALEPSGDSRREQS